MATIYYKELLDLGFIREEYSDNVFLDMHGYVPFEMVLRIRNYSLLWETIDKRVCLYKDEKIIECFDMDTIEDVNNMIEFLK